MSMVISGDNGLTFPAGSTQLQAGNFQTMVNRIINPRMEIDQRNAGAATANTINGYTLDRWRVFQSVAGKFTVQQNAGSVTPPAGFNNYLGVTSVSAYSVGAGDYYLVDQPIEGFNVADLGWGASTAQTVTVSFWVRSSLTGTFGASISNESFNRTYPFTYTISSANTWEYKTVTIPGDTSGSWNKTNSNGMQLRFVLGCGSARLSSSINQWNNAGFDGPTGSTSVVGTNGATFYITGVDLRVGSYTVVPQDFRAYGTELALCQRYYFRFNANTSNWLGGAGYSGTTTTARVPITFPVQMRAVPTAVDTSGTAADYRVMPAGVALSVVPALNTSNTTDGWLSLTVASGLTANAVAVLSAASGVSTAYVGWSAEL